MCALRVSTIGGGCILELGAIADAMDGFEHQRCWIMGLMTKKRLFACWYVVLLGNCMIYSLPLDLEVCA
jgi:hypothetical protein